MPTAEQPHAAHALAEPKAGEKPRDHYYKFMANARCPKEGAWTGTDLVFTGDTFFLLLQPTTRKVRGPDGKQLWKDGKPLREACDRELPTWADVVEEYEVPTAPKPVKPRVAGAAPEVPHTARHS